MQNRDILTDITKASLWLPKQGEGQIKGRLTDTDYYTWNR